MRISSVKDDGPDDLAAACAEIQAMQRRRVQLLQSRIMLGNRLRATVARYLGYHAGLAEADRERTYVEAEAVIARVAATSPDAPCDEPCAQLIRASLLGVDAFDVEKANVERPMVKLARTLPAHKWVKHPDQNGFGELSLAIVVGECGDLRNYANPAKVWRRMGCAPWSFDGQTLMGATWKGGREGKLPAAEWESFGYAPRRRSIAYLIGEGIVKQNFVRQPGDGEAAVDTDTAGAAPGPYRRRYDAVKAACEATRPDWTACECGGSGLGPKGKKCPGCSGRGKKMLRCHRHAMLLATKMLLRDLWNAWHGKPAGGGEAALVTESTNAPARRVHTSKVKTKAKPARAKRRLVPNAVVPAAG